MADTELGKLSTWTWRYRVSKYKRVLSATQVPKVNSSVCFGNLTITWKHATLSNMEGSKKDIDANQTAVAGDIEKTSTNEFSATLTPAQQKRTIRALDLRVTVVLGVLYLIGQVDRNNLGNANIAGMGRDLELTGSRYSIIVLCIFATYSTTQTITLILLRKFGPRVFYTVSACAWGVLVIAIGMVRNWYEVLPLRIVLGFFESGMLPGGVLLLSCWYTKYELQTRLAIFYCIGITASAFAGIISFGVAKMEGLGVGPRYWGAGLVNAAGRLTGEHAPGVSGWRWIFIMFGVVTFGVAIICFPLIVSFPEKQTTHQPWAVKFLSQGELDWVVSRIQQEREDVYAEDFSFKFYIKQLADVDV